MIPCAQCGKEPAAENRCVASISGSMLGDEWTESWYLCPACNVYSVRVCCEPFFGEETVSIRGPIAKEAGDTQIALIGQCPEPWNKKCRCSAHMTYFQGQLD